MGHVPKLCFAKTLSGEGRLCGNNVTPSAKLLIYCGIYFWRSTGIVSHVEEYLQELPIGDLPRVVSNLYRLRVS